MPRPVESAAVASAPSPETAPVLAHRLEPEPEPEPAILEDDFEVTGQVVCGEPDHARNVAVVDVERCFDLIGSYRKVKLEKNSRDYARYLLLLAQANDEFRAAVECIALREGLDLVVERGGVRGGQPVDITNVVCDRLRDAPSRLTTR